jgi:hypothetical protein
MVLEALPSRLLGVVEALLSRLLSTGGTPYSEYSLSKITALLII